MSILKEQALNVHNNGVTLPSQNGKPQEEIDKKRKLDGIAPLIADPPSLKLHQ